MKLVGVSFVFGIVLLAGMISNQFQRLNRAELSRRPLLQKRIKTNVKVSKAESIDRIWYQGSFEIHLATNVEQAEDMLFSRVHSCVMGADRVFEFVGSTAENELVDSVSKLGW